MGFKKSDIEITDNVLNMESFYRLSDSIMLSNDWTYYDYTAPCEKGGKDHIANYHFANTPYDQGKQKNALFDECRAFLDAIECCMIYRIKINMNMAHSHILTQGWHADMAEAPIGVRSGILYLNNTDGGTLFEADDGEVKIECVSNRFVSFPAQMLHTGMTHTNTKHRCALNINYMPWRTHG